MAYFLREIIKCHKIILNKNIYQLELITTLFN